MKTTPAIIIVILLAVLALGSLIWRMSRVVPVESPDDSVNPAPNPAPQPAPEISIPIADALTRVTKKPFGIKITPQTSPVQPERFAGYHTGADFETTLEEQTIDVAISAICTGTLLQARTASGYGGVAVQSCRIDDSDVTVVYGHVRLSSIAQKAGDTITVGQQFAVLGTGESVETDGERKHLHLGIHKGTAINIKGYVQTAAELSGWIDPLTILR